jgi:hypothetical protein
LGGETVETVDSITSNILKGAHVRYQGTGSAGEVLDLRSDDEGLWAKVDTTDLWYNTRYLEVLDEEEYQKLKSKEVRRRVIKINEEADEKQATKKKVESFKKKLEDVDMSSELCDGGG